MVFKRLSEAFHILIQLLTFYLLLKIVSVHSTRSNKLVQNTAHALKIKSENYGAKTLKKFKLVLP
jgi:hypothetical protein